MSTIHSAVPSHPDRLEMKSKFLRQGDEGKNEHKGQTDRCRADTGQRKA